MNKYIYTLTGVTEAEFKLWCKKYKQNNRSALVKRKFFKLIQDNLIIRDQNGNLITKVDIK